MGAQFHPNGSVECLKNSITFPRIIPRPMYGIDYDETFSVVAKIYLYAY